VPRAWVVLAKLAGGVLSLWVPLALAFLLSLVLVLANPDVVLSLDDGLRLAVLFGLACLFLAQVYALSLMVSTLVRESDTALITCLLAWLISGVGFLNVLPSLSRYLVSEPPYQEYADQSEQLWREYGQRLDEWEARHPSPGPAYLKGIERQGYLRYAHPRGYDWLTARSPWHLKPWCSWPIAAMSTSGPTSSRWRARPWWSTPGQRSPRWPTSRY